MAWDHDENRCPLAAVDQRLDDLHRLWHQAEDAYFDPGAFRVAIQSAIQTMRSVTFILQKNKAIIPDFDRWYGEWQKTLGADPLMVWMRDARNTIEKAGDLDAHSFVRAEIVASYLDNDPRVDVPAKLWDAPLQLVKSIPAGAVGDHIRKDEFSEFSDAGSRTHCPPSNFSTPWRSPTAVCRCWLTMRTISSAFPSPKPFISKRARPTLKASAADGCPA